VPLLLLRIACEPGFIVKTDFLIIHSRIQDNFPERTIFLQSDSILLDSLGFSQNKIFFPFSGNRHGIDRSRPNPQHDLKLVLAETAAWRKTRSSPLTN
jgi:hypothetical protein